MIALLIRNAWKQLSRDRAAQVLSFVVPLVFFSIFAMIFGSGSRVTGTSRVELVVVDESNTERSRALIQALEADSGLRVITKQPQTVRGGAPGAPFTRELAERSGRGATRGRAPPARGDPRLRERGRHARPL